MKNFWKSLSPKWRIAFITGIAVVIYLLVRAGDPNSVGPSLFGTDSFEPGSGGENDATRTLPFARRKGDQTCAEKQNHETVCIDNSELLNTDKAFGKKGFFPVMSK